MAHILVGSRGNMGFAQRVDPDPAHPSWVGVCRFLALLPDLQSWKFHVSPAESSRIASADRDEE